MKGLFSLITKDIWNILYTLLLVVAIVLVFFTSIFSFT